MTANLDASALRKSIKGQILTRSDTDFEKVALDVWNKYGTSKRRPQLIVRVADEQDVVEAVKFAKARKLKVVVRGGGRNSSVMGGKFEGRIFFSRDLWRDGLED